MALNAVVLGLPLKGAYIEKAYRRNANDWADVDLGEGKARVTHRESGRSVTVTRDDENTSLMEENMISTTPMNQQRYNARIGVAAKKLGIPLAD